MREIGGYFGLESFSGREYYGELTGVNSGRNALLYILKARKYRKLYIPRFLCDSVSMLCRREGYVFEEYPIGADFMPVFEGVLQPDEVLYIVNFYGQISNVQAAAMKERWGNVIFDNVQAFFQKPVPNIDTVYSCRKFFGVPDGGYAACGALTPETLSADRSFDRMTHVLGRYEGSASEYYRVFQQNDERFYDLPLRAMSKLTRNLLRAVDYEAVRNKRNENYAILDEALGRNNGIHPIAPDGPYCYPFYCKNGMLLKKRLAEKKIYVATLWPNVLEYDGTLEKDYAENILPLPCDQRYDTCDMQRIIDEIQKYSAPCFSERL